MAEPSEFQQLIHLLIDRLDRQLDREKARHETAETRHVATEARLDRQEQQQEATNDILRRMLTQQEALFSLHLSFQEKQEKHNEHQDQFSIIFLEEVRDIKRDVRDVKKDFGTLKDVVLKQYDERLKKPENFMDGFLRKAG